MYNNENKTHNIINKKLNENNLNRNHKINNKDLYTNPLNIEIKSNITEKSDPYISDNQILIFKSVNEFL